MKFLKKRLKKAKAYLFLSACAVSSAVTTAQAATPKFDEAKATATAKEWLDPLMHWGLLIIPACAIVRIAVAGISWFQKDEQEREQNPFHRTIITYLKWTIIIEMIPIIYSIFGLSGTF